MPSGGPIAASAERTDRDLLSLAVDVTFLGLPLRLGYIIGVPKNPKAVLPIVGLEAFVKLDANIFSLTDDGQPSPWHAGARLNFYVLYVEAAASFPTFSVRDRGLAIEAGIGF